MNKDDARVERQHAPEGWRLVPVTPTWAMHEAANREWDGRMSARSAGVWQAMIAAAPEPVGSASNGIAVKPPWWPDPPVVDKGWPDVKRDPAFCPHGVAITEYCSTCRDAIGGGAGRVEPSNVPCPVCPGCGHVYANCSCKFPAEGSASEEREHG